MPTIDLNCDLGEIPELRAVDLQLMTLITSANIACGGHAGDEESMRAMVEAATAQGVAIVAHPGYPDKAGFGRVEMELPCWEIERTVAAQVGALSEIAAASGSAVQSVKPHGALYHAAMKKRDVAEAIAAGTRAVNPALMLVGQAGSQCLQWWKECGFRVVAEAFADRRYEADGTLRARTKAGALIENPAAAAEQAVRIAGGQGVVVPDGRAIPIKAETLCTHGDTSGAVQIARAVRDGLHKAGITVAPVNP